MSTPCIHNLLTTLCLLNLLIFVFLHIIYLFLLELLNLIFGTNLEFFFFLNDVRKNRCKAYQRLYLFPKGSGTSYLKRYHDKTHSLINCNILKLIVIVAP